MSNSANTRRLFLKRLGALLATGGLLVKTPLAAASRLIGDLGKIAGEVIARSHEQYELWRTSMVWYMRKDKRYPDLIVRAKTDQDVIEAVNHARENRLKISVRSTGHHITRVALREGGLLLDVSELNNIEVDPDAREAWVQPGVRSQVFMDAIGEHGLAFPAAHTAEVGLGGYLLGGGLGWNLPEWDMACRNVIEAEIVTADGKKVLASETENQELLWAVRGAGPGFFGVVLRYKLRLFPLPKNIVKTIYILPDEELETVSSELNRLSRDKDDKLEILAVLKHSEDIPGMPKEGIACIVSVFAFVDTHEEAMQLLKPFAESKLREKAIVKKENRVLSIPESYEGQRVTDQTSLFRTSVDNMWTDEPVKAFHIIAERLRSSPDTRDFSITAWGFSVKDRDDTAVPRFADNYFAFYMLANDESDVEPNYEWIAKTCEELQPITKGRYINETETRRLPDHVKECFSPQGWERLQVLRKKYDPSGVFHGYLVTE
jgi:FAD/FMN-containing dehydrogenase